MKYEKYITGKYALNIHHPEDNNEPTGDWHGYIWDNITELPNNKITYAGNGFKINTFSIWGDFGIYDDTDNFKKKGIIIKEKYVFVADYYRAILDLIYYNLLDNENLMGLNCITYDHFDNNKQINVIFDKVKLLNNNINEKQYAHLEDWILSEKKYFLQRVA